MEDDLIRIFAGDTLKQNMQRYGMTEDEIIESRFVSKTIERAQEKVEKTNFETRKHLLEYDDVLNQHRKVIYAYRRSILDNEQDSIEQIQRLIAECIEDLVNASSPKEALSTEQVQEIVKSVSRLTHIPAKDFPVENNLATTKNDLIDQLTNLVTEHYKSYRSKQADNRIADLERWMMLEAIDTAWKQHMLNIDHLKEGIGYRGWGQKNPLFEYKKEAFDMFQDMLRSIHWDIVHRIFTVNAAHFNRQEMEQQRQAEMAQLRLNFSEGELAKAAASKQQSKKDKRR